MRWCVELSALFAAMAVHAFDSDAWLAKRARLDTEAARLRNIYAQCVTNVVSPAENVTVPVETHPDGSVKTSVFAKRAQFFVLEGYIWGSGVKIRQYRRDGSLAAWIDADNCVVDRKTRCGWVDGRAKAKYRDEAELEGVGVFFSAAGEYLKVFSETKLTTEGRRLTSVRADYDHQEGVAMFDGDVFLKGKEKDRAYEFETDRAFAFMAGTNDLRRIVALGNVRVRSEGRSGACARAVYRKRGAKITMYGDGADAPARLVDTARRRSELEGSRITFWLDGEQVEVTDSRISVDTKGMKLPKGPEAR